MTNTLIPQISMRNIIVYLVPVIYTTDLQMPSHMHNVIRPNPDLSGVSDCLDNKGKSIVREAIQDNNQALLERILKQQPDLVNAIDEEGLTPLSFAASKGYIAITSKILELYPKSINIPNKDNTLSYPVHKATLGGHVEILKLFHDTCPQSFEYLDRHGQTVLHLAAKQRRNKLKSVVSYLLSLDEGRNLLNIKDENRNSPLNLARNYGNREVEEIIKNYMAL